MLVEQALWQVLNVLAVGTDRWNVLLSAFVQVTISAACRQVESSLVVTPAKGPVHCGGMDEAQRIYKCFMLSRLQLSPEPKKCGSKARGGCAAVLLACFCACSISSLSIPSQSCHQLISLLSRFNSARSVCHLLSLAIRPSAASPLIAPPYLTSVFS